MAEKKAKSKVRKPVGTVSKPQTIGSDVNQLIKVCRLCESKDGPFLNIFDTEKMTAKKIEDLMPFRIAENDDLPHKICFRCSAKLEELHEFIQKCINTQRNLRIALGKKEPLVTKTKMLFWEDNLNKSNISQDDICDAVIKKAMEGITTDAYVTLNQFPEEDRPTVTTVEKSCNELPMTYPVEIDCKLTKETKKSIESSNNSKNIPINDEFVEAHLPCKSMKLSADTYDHKVISTRSSRSKLIEPLNVGLEVPTKIRKYTNKQKLNLSNTNSETIFNIVSGEESITVNDIALPEKESDKTAVISQKIINLDKEMENPEAKTRPFNIMDHISTIKVNGVGVLYQCKLCNRNFLNKRIVISHGCAKSGIVPKEDFAKKIIPPEPPKAPTVKYINTKLDM